MARILLLTDLSANAQHAATYAVHLFGRSGNTYEMAHAHLDVGFADPMVPVYMPELQKAAAEGLSAAARTFNEHTGVPVAEEHLLLGPLPAALLDLLEHRQMDAVVMGMSGRGGAMLFGSTAAAVVRSCTVPVVVVPQQARVRPLQRILLADDHGVVAAEDLSLLRSIALRHDAEVLVTYVPETVTEGAEHWSNGIYELGLAGVPHRFTEAHGKNVTDALEHALVERRADLLTVLHRHTGLLERLLHRSVTKQVVHATDRPLLVLQQGE